MTWREFWNKDTPIYVNERHKAVHYATIARQIAALVPSPAATVLDYGSGEALSADLVARRCSRLVLCDSSELVRRRLHERFAALGNVSILEPEEIHTLAPGSVDLIVVNSVVQYLGRSELDQLVAALRPLLAPDGQILFADIIPPDVGAATDALALLSLAAANGFFFSAVGGLVRTLFSDYRTTRNKLGLAHYSEADFSSLLTKAGFRVRRHFPNLGHNQSRMAFMAEPS